MATLLRPSGYVLNPLCKVKFNAEPLESEGQDNHFSASVKKQKCWCISTDNCCRNRSACEVGGDWQSIADEQKDQLIQGA